MMKAHVAGPMWRYLKDTCPEASPTGLGGLIGVPVIVSNELTGGQWQIWEDGELEAHGDIAPAPDGMAIDYAQFVGWFAYDPDLLERVVGVGLAGGQGRTERG